MYFNIQSGPSAYADASAICTNVIEVHARGLTS
jgi:hypothetical protein